MLIEDVGKSNGLITHNAMVIISYDKKNRYHNFQSYLQSGRKGDFKGELIDGKLYWYSNKNIRYIISLNKKDQWYEIGEIQHGEQ